jgi:asparagine synthase (glutamine-hydrolysing)
VTVALSGDGGDELFGGYDRYLFAAGLWGKIARIPEPLRAAAGRALMQVPASAWNRIGDSAARLLPRSLRARRLGEKVHKVAPMLSAESLDRLYDGVVAAWPGEASPVLGATGRRLLGPQLGGLSGASWMMARDMLGYLPSDILVKVDRAAMAVGLETRVPFLDPEVVEFAWRLPVDLKIRRGTTKWLLRQVLYRHVPARLIERPKTGFSVPLDEWLRGPLRDWAEALLDPGRLREEGFFEPREIQRAWQGQLAGEGNASRLWSVLMFEAWLQEHGSTAGLDSAPHAAAIAG